MWLIFASCSSVSSPVRMSGSMSASARIFFASGQSNAVNIRERSFNALLVRDLNSKESGHDSESGRLDRSALALFVARVLADDAHHALPPDDAAGFTEALDGGTDLHEVGENKPATGRCRAGSRDVYHDSARPQARSGGFFQEFLSGMGLQSRMAG